MTKRPNKPLRIPEIRAGYLAALRHARKLAGEAELLGSAGNYAAAHQRLVIALEEIGKTRLFSYQGSLLVGRRPTLWTRFWRDYYSHVAKLEVMLTWAQSDMILSAPDAAAVRLMLTSLSEHAQKLDLSKQASAYSDHNGVSFGSPDDDDFKASARQLATLASALVDRTDADSLSTATDDAEFEAELKRKFKYAAILGLMDSDSGVELTERVAQFNAPVALVNDAMPDEAALEARIAERYVLLPRRLPVTLPALVADQRFRKFYTRITARRGYPDWILLGTIFNIVLNARVDTEMYAAENRIEELKDWSEDPTVDRPLRTSLFTDQRTFECHLDGWLVAFFAGLGILTQSPGERLDGRARRVGTTVYPDLLRRDVPHDPIFTWPRAAG